MTTTAPPRHWGGPLGSMRVRILAAVLVLLAGSSAVSILLLRGVLLTRLDEEVGVALERETEEFQLLADGLNPRTGLPFGGDLTAVFDVYFAREVPDDGEALLAFRGPDLYRVEAAPDAVPTEQLAGAVGFWLTLDDPRSGAAERSDTIALIVREIERMNRIVDELLLLARSERPGGLFPEPVALGDLTRDVYRNATVLCEREWLLESAADAVVVIDGQRITQAMVQLAENACRHTPPGTPVRIGSAVRNGHIRLWVHDAGPGIPDADSERIFQRFVKGSEHAGGSGLGLSIVAAIAEAHGGRAEVVRGARPGPGPPPGRPGRCGR